MDQLGFRLVKGLEIVVSWDSGIKDVVVMWLVFGSGYCVELSRVREWMCFHLELDSGYPCESLFSQYSPKTDRKRRKT